MTVLDASVIAGITFIAGGFFGAALQLRSVIREIDAPLRRLRSATNNSRREGEE